MTFPLMSTVIMLGPSAADAMPAPAPRCRSISP